MPAPAFGFSAGDFMAGIQLIVKVAKALKDSGAVASEYQNLHQDLQSLQAVFEQLRDLPTASSPSLNHYNAVRGLALTVLIPLQEFLDKLQKFKTPLGINGRAGAGWRGATKKLQWTFEMKEEVHKIRAVVTMKIVSITGATYRVNWFSISIAAQLATLKTYLQGLALHSIASINCASRVVTSCKRRDKVLKTRRMNCPAALTA